jgi:hypothetical protein
MLPFHFSVENSPEGQACRGRFMDYIVIIFVGEPPVIALIHGYILKYILLYILRYRFCVMIYITTIRTPIYILILNKCFLLQKIWQLISLEASNFDLGQQEIKKASNFDLT